MSNNRLPARSEGVAVLGHLAAQIVVPLERHHAALQLLLAPRRTLVYGHCADGCGKTRQGFKQKYES